MSVAQLGANAITAVNNRRYTLGTVARLLCKLSYKFQIERDNRKKK